jgi:Fic family protein
VRTESVASSKIEAIEAGLDDYARALHGSRSNDSAVAMVAATAALEAMIRGGGPGRDIELSAITDAHAVLMRDDPSERRYAGRVRDVQTWIGGSDHSPRNALFVPPPPDAVAEYLDDLLDFANRDDLPVLVQAAIAHAQFESIHPFTDGNGRIGRALINLILRRRGVTTRVVLPLASALVAHRERYFGLLTAYREGDVSPLVLSFARAARVAAVESRVTAGRLGELGDEWRAAVGDVRRGSAVAMLLDALPSRPIVTADDVAEITGAVRSGVFAAINRLHDGGVLRPLSDRRRDRIWGAAAVLDELEDLGHRIAAAVR